MGVSFLSAGSGLIPLVGGILWSLSVPVSGQVPTTFDDFHLSGTQIGDASPDSFDSSQACATCHGDYDPEHEPYSNWQGSLMGQAGRDPLFFAQMTNANQDVENAGYFCMRCHVPMSFVTGNAYDPSGASLDEQDRDGVTCHFCHSMVDPIYKPGISPAEDEAVLDGLEMVPSHYGNSMFVLDPSGLRRGPYDDPSPMLHQVIQSPFFRSGDLCGTCHDVGNVAVSKQEDGTYRYNLVGAPPPDEDLYTLFPLERTYSEWKLSEFATEGVDMGGIFGGTGSSVVSTCQDCHMPKAVASGCVYSDPRSDLAVHEFAGASSWVLEIIALQYAGDPAVDQDAIEVGRQKAIAMVGRAAALEVDQLPGSLGARVINQSGHKLPTGHIEGRRVWTNVRILDGSGELLHEYGHYDREEAHLDEDSTVVYEMKVGLSEDAAAATGLSPGVTTHMALADTIVKDTRIPPRGFDNAAFTAAGAPVVGALYEDGQYWDSLDFWLPEGARSAEVTVYYQTATRHYIEALRDGNVTDDWGETLYDLWTATDKAAPVPIVAVEIPLESFTRFDFDFDGDVDAEDYEALELCFGDGLGGPYPVGCALGDFDGDRDIDCFDGIRFAAAWTEADEAPTLPGCLGTIDVPALSKPGLILLALCLVGLGAFRVDREKYRNRSMNS